MESDKDTTSKDTMLPFEITEDTDNIYILNYIIPKDNNKENLKKREKIIWEMYGRWCVENPNKKGFNKNLKCDIIVTFSGI